MISLRRTGGRLPQLTLHGWLSLIMSLRAKMALVCAASGDGRADAPNEERGAATLHFISVRRRLSADAWFDVPPGGC